MLGVQKLLIFVWLILQVVRSLVNAAQVALNGFSDAVEEELRSSA